MVPGHQSYSHHNIGLRVERWVSTNQSSLMGQWRRVQIASYSWVCIFPRICLSWAQHINAITKKAHQCLYFLTRLKRFSMSTTTLSHLYTCMVEYILTGSTTPMLSDERDFRAIDTGQSNAGSELPTLEEIIRRCLKEATNVIKYPHYSYIGFSLTS